MVVVRGIIATIGDGVSCHRMGLSIDSLVAHGRHIARPYAHGPSCRVCLPYPPGRSRVTKHLAYSSSRCLPILQAQSEPVTAEESDELDEIDQLL